MTDPDAQDDRRRRKMVQNQIIARGIRDENVIRAMKNVPRELFAGEDNTGYAFHDGPLSIGYGQTISQPYIVAYMTEEARLGPDDRVLEIGTGCGYQTAVLAEIVFELYTVEIIEELQEKAAGRLAEAGYGNIRFRAGDGGLGWPEQAPFDAIIVTAAPVSLPETLGSQLAEGGRMIIPVGGSVQHLHRYTMRGGTLDDEELIGVRFVPMTGKLEDHG